MANWLARMCVAVDDDKTAESVHFVYEIPYSGICGLVGTYPTIFDEQRSCLRPIAGATTSTRERMMSKNAARGSV